MWVHSTYMLNYISFSNWTAGWLYVLHPQPLHTSVLRGCTYNLSSTSRTHMRKLKEKDWHVWIFRNSKFLKAFYWIIVMIENKLKRDFSLSLICFIYAETTKYSRNDSWRMYTSFRFMWIATVTITLCIPLKVYP